MSKRPRKRRRPRGKPLSPPALRARLDALAVRQPQAAEGRAGDAVGRLLAERWRAHGVDIRLRTGLVAFRADASGRISSVLLTDGTELRADIAQRFANGFDDPVDFFDWFMFPDKAEAYLAQVGAA